MTVTSANPILLHTPTKLDCLESKTTTVLDHYFNMHKHYEFAFIILIKHTMYLDEVRGEYTKTPNEGLTPNNGQRPMYPSVHHSESPMYTRTSIHAE